MGDSSDDKKASVCQASISKASAFAWLLFSAWWSIRAALGYSGPSRGWALLCSARGCQIVPLPLPNLGRAIHIYIDLST